MEKKSGLTKVLRILLGLSIVLTLFFQLIKPSQTYQNIDHSLYSVSSYLRYVLLQSPVQTIQDAINGFTSLSSAQQENKILRQNLDEVKQLQARLIETNKEIVELQNLLQLKSSLTSMKSISGNVIEKDATNFNNSLLVNVGSNDGVQLSMAVITPSGLIGQVSHVNENTSIVRLLTSQEGANQFALKIQLDQQSSVEALLEGYDLEEQRYIVRLLDSNKSIKEGLKVVTSGLGEIIPGGLLVGEIESFESSPATLSVILKVKPSASFSNLNVVLIVGKP